VKRTILVAALLCVAALGGVVMAGGQAAQPSPMAEQVFKNIQVLKGIPVDEFMGTMGVFSSATGLNCTDCHVDESGGSWAKYADDNALKQRTRTMIVMMNAINRTNFGGRQVVTCVTCHRGSPRPTVMPSINALYAEPPPDEPGDSFVQAPGRPAADQVLDKYIAAIGGAARVAALTSYSAKGTYIGFDDADTSPMEIHAKAPGQRATILHRLDGDTHAIVDGRSAWLAAPPADRPVPLVTYTGAELDGLKLEAELLFPSRIRQALTQWRVGIPAVLGDRDVQVVQGTTAGGAVATLCFDAETGLLVRLIRYGNSPVGRIVTRVDYSDYRDVAGVKMPFKWTVAWLSGRSHYELTDVQPNVPVDAVRFNRPSR
jgi:hypothetical protein